MLENIWFQFIAIVPSIIIFIAIPLGVLWIAFYFLKPKMMSFWTALGIMVLSYVLINIFQLVAKYIVGLSNNLSAIISWVIGFVLFMIAMKKYRKISSVVSAKFFALILITSLVLVFSIAGFK